MSGLVQTNSLITLSGADLAYTVSAVDSGKTFLLVPTAGTALVISLPANAAGLHYRFMNGSAITATIAITATGATISGTCIMGPTNGVALLAISGRTTINFLANTAVTGDIIDLYSSGSLWYIQAASRVAGGITTN